jgi:hypothetical protein
VRQWKGALAAQSDPKNQPGRYFGVRTLYFGVSSAAPIKL